MNKYRELTLEELHLFEKEFTQYLAVNGIDASLWKKMKIDEPEKADKLISIFGDVIYNTVLKKVKYIEMLATDSIKYFSYLSDKAILIGVDGKNVDFSNKDSIVKAIGNPNSKIEVYSTSKNYTKTREEEIFDMLKMGCSISDGSMFDVLKKTFYLDKK